MATPTRLLTRTQHRPPSEEPCVVSAGQADVLSSSLWINELFVSIQGEGLDVGSPCLFVRLAGCNLRCSYCDTEYAWERDGARQMSVRDVLAEADARRTELVEITGGEPLLQPGVIPLMRELIRRGHRVLLETSGHEDARAVAEGVVRIIDVKTPGSKMAHGTYATNLTSLRPTDQVKFVLLDRADYEWARAQVAAYDLVSRTAAVLFGPAHGLLPPGVLAEWILQDRLSVRLHVQLHKYIWGADRRGV